jgi:uroporphyrinogen decarboxylase
MNSSADDSASFAQLRVAAFESRRASEMARLIERQQGIAHVSPSMREVPLDDAGPIIDFAKKLMTGAIDVVVFLTGVGFEYLLESIGKSVDRDRFLTSLADITTVVRGPKPLAALRSVGLQPTYVVPPPNTWREVLATLDSHCHMDNQTVALQEYGKANRSLTAGLEARGARVLSVSVYRWEMPTDTTALEENVRAIAAGERDIVLFTSAQQVANALRMADDLGLASQLRQKMQECVVASIGPTTSEALREEQLPVDLEPSSAKMGKLVLEAAAASGELLRRKKRLIHVLSQPPRVAQDTEAAWFNGPFMKACRREPQPHTPIWLMRQAGRYLPEYREIRAKTTFLELCKNPELCAEVMVTTVKRLGVDAAIIFSDLLPILEPMGLELEYAQGEGPIIHNPVREPSDVDRVVALETIDSLEFVTDTVRLTRAELPPEIPVIGFAGAPFTLASYVIEGGASRNYLNTKTMMYRDEGAWRSLMVRLVDSIVVYLNAQIAAGAQCVQLFDSWVGCLGPDDYRRYVLPFVRDLISRITPGVPVISFGTGNPALLPLLAEGQSQVVGIDWRIGLDDAWQRVGHNRAVQGNLDPMLLLADRRELLLRARHVLDQAGGRPGHIFNLGHGVLPQTPVDNVLALIDYVHEYSARKS